MEAPSPCLTSHFLIMTSSLLDFLYTSVYVKYVSVAEYIIKISQKAGTATFIEFTLRRISEMSPSTLRTLKYFTLYRSSLSEDGGSTTYISSVRDKVIVELLF